MANETVIVIRAQDQASAALESINERIQSLTSSLVSGVGLVAGSVAAIASSKKLLQIMESSQEAYLDSRKALRDLNETQVEYVNQLQNVIGLEDESTGNLIRRAKLLGVQEEQIKDVTTAAVGLAEVTGMSLESSLMKVNEAINGNANAWASYLPAIREVKSEEEKLAIIMEAAERGIDKRLEKGGDIEGALSRRSAAFQDLQASIGAVIAPTVMMQDTLAAMATVAADAIDGLAERFSGSGSTMTTVARVAAETFVGAISVFRVGFERIGDILELTKVTVEFNLRFYFETIRHTLAVQIPQLLVWFANNWQAAFEDMFSFARTVTVNGFQVLTDLFRAGWKAITERTEQSQIDMAFAVVKAVNTNLLEGFEATAEALPDLIGRKLTDREIELLTKMGILGKKLGGAFQQAIIDGTADLKDVFDSFRDTSGLNFDLSTLGAPESSRSNELRAVESRLLTRGPAETPLDAIRASSENTAKATGKAAELLTEINNELKEQKPGNDRQTLGVEFVD